MLSSTDLERLITEKRFEIDKEKTVLGLKSSYTDVEENKENYGGTEKKVQVSKERILTESNVAKPIDKCQGIPGRRLSELEEEIPPDLERYIRRCTGLPGMLKAGEYSPNNPLIRAERATGDALLGLGEYERRRNTLRKLRQQQYREYLDQQARLKQEAKEKAEKERREREEKDRARDEERELESRQLEQQNVSPIRRRVSLNYGHDVSSGSNNNMYITKVDTAVQVGRVARPLSVAVQTDDVELYRVSPNHQKLTQAERGALPTPSGEQKWTENSWDQWKMQERRRSYGDFDESSSNLVKKSNRDKLTADLRHSYMPSIFDAEAIQLRNLQAEKEAAARRQYYQQELKNQILEQQRIREERKNREKMLEQAEMRRLEEQLRALKVAQQHETYKQGNAVQSMKEHSSEYEKKRTALQKEIEKEKKSLQRATSQYQPVTRIVTQTSHSEKNPSKLPFYYSQHKMNHQERPPYSINIPDNSIFSPNYDVDSYLRRNLNPSRESLISNNLQKEAPSRLEIDANKNYIDTENYINNEKNKNVTVEKVLIHTKPIEKRNTKPVKEDTLPIPVLRHSPISVTKDTNENTDLSEAMRIVEDKWKIPVVQKNILKTLPKEDGKNVNILTQLGSIRRQLQLEQLKLDNMVPKDDDV